MPRTTWARARWRAPASGELMTLLANRSGDSAGEIYATKSGDLKIVTEGNTGKAYWKKGQTKNELIVLELLPNRYLIYRELGIYGQLGVVCDAQ
jgi:hypothetical protein